MIQTEIARPTYPQPRWQWVWNLAALVLAVATYVGAAVFCQATGGTPEVNWIPCLVFATVIYLIVFSFSPGFAARQAVMERYAEQLKIASQEAQRKQLRLLKYEVHPQEGFVVVWFQNGETVTSHEYRTDSVTWEKSASSSIQHPSGHYDLNGEWQWGEPTIRCPLGR